MKTQDEGMRGLIQRCQTMENGTRENKYFIDTKLPNDLHRVEEQIYNRCSSLVESSLNPNTQTYRELKTDVNNRLTSLKTKISEIQTQLRDTAPVPEDEERRSIDLLVAQKIEEIDLPSKIQVELKHTNFLERDDGIITRLQNDIVDLRGTIGNNSNKPYGSGDGLTLIGASDIEERISEKINSIDIRAKVEEEVIASRCISITDPKIVKLQKDVTMLELQLKSNAESSLKTRKDIRSSPPSNDSTTSTETSAAPPLMSVNVQAPDKTNSPPHPNMLHAKQENQSQIDQRGSSSVELVLCFDSNGKYINRKKLWKKNNSVYKRCATLYKVAEEMKTLEHTSIQHLLISVGTNDLDTKTYDQVLGELDILLAEIRLKHQGIKFIINEFLPRNDNRNDEVDKFNHHLKQYCKTQPDITVATQENLRNLSFLSDTKHLQEVHIPKYAKNIINGLLRSYGISDKTELFDPSKNIHYGSRVQHSNRMPVNNSSTNDIHRRMLSLANYDDRTSPQCSNNRSIDPYNYSDDQLKHVLSLFNRVLQNGINR